VGFGLPESDANRIFQKTPVCRPLLPLFTVETAVQKARVAEDAWNSRDLERVMLN